MNVAELPAGSRALLSEAVCPVPLLLSFPSLTLPASAAGKIPETPFFQGAPEGALFTPWQEQRREQQARAATRPCDGRGTGEACLWPALPLPLGLAVLGQWRIVFFLLFPAQFLAWLHPVSGPQRLLLQSAAMRAGLTPPKGPSWLAL